MHDFHEADRISQIIKSELEKNNLKKLNQINLELGSVVEHGEEIKAENLEFNIRLILKDYLNNKTKIIIDKVKGNGWKLVSIDGE